MLVYGKYEYFFVMQMFKFVSCLHPMAVLNAAFCMTYTLVMLVKDARCDHMEYTYSRAVS